MATNAIALPYGQQRIVLEQLSRGQPMSVPRLVSVLYGSRRDGGPEHPNRVVIKTIRELRRRLRPLGITVLSIGVGRNTGSHAYVVDPDHLDKLRSLFAQQASQAIERARTVHTSMAAAAA